MTDAKKKPLISALEFLGLSLLHIATTTCFGALAYATTTALDVFNESARAFGGGVFGGTIGTAITLGLFTVMFWDRTDTPRKRDAHF